LGTFTLDVVLVVATGGGSAAAKAATVADDIADVARVVDDIPDIVRATDNLTTTAKACSFGGATLVLMADGSFTRIDELVPGDVVWASDPETGDAGPREITHVWVHGDTLVDLVAGDGEITTTEDHPFWNHTDQEWQRADRLDEGDWLLGPDGQLVVVGGVLDDTHRWGTAYNLTVEGIPTYYVAIDDTPVLVHNTCGAPNPWGKLGGPRHRAEVQRVSDDIRSRGLTPQGEVRFDTPGGFKSRRYGDVGAYDRGRLVEVHQVGRQTRGGVPVKRERAALVDIMNNNPSGAAVHFHSYN
jgi:hypothetical protein